MSVNKITKKIEIIREECKEEFYCVLCGKKITYYYFNEDKDRDARYNDLEPEENKPVIGMVTEEFSGYEITDSGCTAEIYDICKECYESKIKPLLKKELGLEPRII